VNQNYGKVRGDRFCTGQDIRAVHFLLPYRSLFSIYLNLSLEKEEKRLSETSEQPYHPTRCNNPDSCHLNKIGSDSLIISISNSLLGAT
jgi:hypothetical protein